MSAYASLVARLLARRLGLRSQRVCSETARTGNLGSASLPVAWAARDPSITHPVIWTAVGTGLQWGAVLFDAAQGEHRPTVPTNS